MRVQALGSHRRERAAAAIGSVVLQGLLLYGLLVGLSVRAVPGVDQVMKVFNLAPPPPPPRQREREHPKSSKRAGAASPRNIRSKATEIALPPPPIRIPLPPPILAAPKPYIGRDASTGASNLPGPGTGAGGRGNGTGSGDEGNGEGDGGLPPRHVSGRIKDSDYPKAAWEARAEGTVGVIFRVQTDGHVTDCQVTSSSGNASLDQTTCRLIEQRFRYKPARDRYGRPVTSRLIENHRWDLDIAPAPDRGQQPARWSSGDDD